MYLESIVLNQRDQNFNQVIKLLTQIKNNAVNQPKPGM
jgi:hypothetical protein